MSVVGLEFESLKRFNITELYPKAEDEKSKEKTATSLKEETAANTKDELKEHVKDEPAEVKEN